jgi:hypothetical protein
MHIVAGAAQDGMHGITDGALEPIAAEFAVRLHMPDRGLDGAAPLDHRPQGARDTALLAGYPGLDAGNFHALKSAIDECLFRFHFGEDFGLLQGFVQRMPVVGIAGHRARPHHQPRAVHFLLTNAACSLRACSVSSQQESDESEDDELQAGVEFSLAVLP